MKDCRHLCRVKPKKYSVEAEDVMYMVSGALILGIVLGLIIERFYL